MFRKPDQWLLTRRPLLWNMRVHWILPLIAVFHILFYIAGYLNPVTIKTLDHYYSIGENGGVTAMASLLAVLMFVSWLVFYLRNNAFKSFYPLRNGRLFAEFLLLALIILGLTTFSISWSKGFRDHVRTLTQHTDLEKEAETINLAMHFIPFSPDAFSINSCCDTLQKYADSPYSERAAVTYEDTLPQYHSYLYYCGMEIRSLHGVQLRDQYEVNNVAQRWLKAHRQDSIKYILDAYLQLCDKYGAGYAFNTRKAAETCFATPDFRVQHYIGARRSVEQPVFIESDDVRNSLERIDEVRGRSWRFAGFIVYLYFALYGALLIMSFRLTKLRTWFIAAIGSGIWAMIFGLLTAVTGGAEIVIIPLFSVLIIFFLLHAAWHIYRKKSKLVSGLTYLWFTWSFPSLLPLCMALVLRFHDADMYVYDQAGNAAYVGADPVYEWINGHWELINTCNLALVIVVVALVLIPLARKWQSNPEE